MRYRPMNISTIEEFIIEKSTAFSSVIDFGTHRILWLNSGTLNMFPGTKKGDHGYRAFFGRDTPCGNCPLPEMKASGQSVNMPVWFEEPKRWYKIDYQYAEIDGYECCVCIGTDITGLKSDLHLAQEMLDSFLTLAYIVDRKTHTLRFANRTLRRMLPHMDSRAKCYELLRGRRSPCEDCPLPGLELSQGSHVEMFNEKLGRQLNIGVFLLKTPQDEELGVFTGYDITHRIEYESRLKTLAYTDSQLGIGNRTAFHHDLKKMAESGSSGHLCLASIRNFDNINMLFGRERGDRILEAFAESFMKKTAGGQVYRVGGCKFATTVETYEAGCDMLDAVRKDVYTCLSPEEKNFPVPVDTVFVEFPRFAASPEALLLNAEYRLKSSREGGAGKRMRFGERDRQMMARRSFLTSVIRRAMENGAFQVFYQPIYTVEKADYRKAEALLRLHDPQLGFIGPNEFIPVADAHVR